MMSYSCNACGRYIQGGQSCGCYAPGLEQPQQIMRMSDIPLRPLRATVDADWRTALIGLCVGREADVQTPQAAAEDVRRRLAKMGGTRPVYLDELLAAAEHVVKLHREGKGDILASINHLDNAARFARQVDMGAGSKANWGDLAEAEEE